MSDGRTLVITAYGHDKTIDKIALASFAASDVNTYCSTINSLEFSGNSWALAKTVSENTHYSFDYFLPLKFDIILKLDDRAIQKLLRDVDTYDLAIALKGAKESIKEKIFINMSKRAEQIFKEDIECMGPIENQRTMESQEKIVAIIKHLEDFGEIVIDHGEEIVE
jgi:flagellar motor switch protein FliG